MVLDDGLIDGTGPEAIDRVVRPKVQGALNLARASRDLDLDYLLLYSSATALFGNPGQYNYVAANAFLEGLARQLRAEGRPALAVGWGAIEDAGYLARTIEADPHLKKRFGANMITARRALDALDWAFDDRGHQLSAAYVVAKIDWSLARHDLAATRGTLHGRLGGAASARQSAGAAELAEELRSKPYEEAVGLLQEIVVEQIARVLRLPPKEIDRHRPLADVGMDSLMMVELRAVVEDALAIELPMMSLASGISPADVALRILSMIRGAPEATAVTGTLAALSSSHLGPEADAEEEERKRLAASAMLKQISSLDAPP
jgi:acyl carrier protein